MGKWTSSELCDPFKEAKRGRPINQHNLSTAVSKVLVHVYEAKRRIRTSEIPPLFPVLANPPSIGYHHHQRSSVEPPFRRPSRLCPPRFFRWSSVPPTFWPRSALGPLSDLHRQVFPEPTPFEPPPSLAARGGSPDTLYTHYFDTPCWNLRRYIDRPFERYIFNWIFNPLTTFLRHQSPEASGWLRISPNNLNARADLFANIPLRLLDHLLCPTLHPHSVQNTERR